MFGDDPPDSACSVNLQHLCTTRRTTDGITALKPPYWTTRDMRMSFRSVTFQCSGRAVITEKMFPVLQETSENIMRLCSRVRRCETASNIINAYIFHVTYELI